MPSKTTYINKTASIKIFDDNWWLMEDKSPVDIDCIWIRSNFGSIYISYYKKDSCYMSFQLSPSELLLLKSFLLIDQTKSFAELDKSDVFSYFELKDEYDSSGQYKFVLDFKSNSFEGVGIEIANIVGYFPVSILQMIANIDDLSILVIKNLNKDTIEIFKKSDN
jgi:hypothetical protein